MASRPRPSSASGPGQGPAGRRPSRAVSPPRRTRTSTGATAARLEQASRARLTGRAAILLLILAVLAVSYASSARAWLNQRSEINSLRTQISERGAQVAELEQTKARWDDPAYVEAQARLRFGWVMPGEVGYRVIDDDGSVMSDSDSLSEPVTERPAEAEWWESAWGSVVGAGKDPADESEMRDTTKRKPLDRIGGPRDSKLGHR